MWANIAETYRKLKYISYVCVCEKKGKVSITRLPKKKEKKM